MAPGLQLSEALPLSEPPAKVLHCPDNEPKRKKGPKYHVLPGGSRPTQAPQSKAPAREFVVLEFRTEPRVVPASRSGREEKAKVAHNMLRFRPNARHKATDHQWVAEREALAAAAKAR